MCVCIYIGKYFCRLGPLCIYIYDQHTSHTTSMLFLPNRFRRNRKPRTLCVSVSVYLCMCVCVCVCVFVIARRKKCFKLHSSLRCCSLFQWVWIIIKDTSLYHQIERVSVIYIYIERERKTYRDRERIERETNRKKNIYLEYELQCLFDHLMLNICKFR